MFGEDLSDANLFGRVRKKDARAFGALMRRHDPALRRLATRLLAEDERVDPVLHKAYTKAWRSASIAQLGGNKGDVVLKWLYRLVYNACVDDLRRQEPRPGPPPPTGPRVRLPKAPEERRVQALRALTPSERIPLVLVDSEGFSVEAAARILQRPPPRVAADLDRARTRWRDLVIGPPLPRRPSEREKAPAETVPGGSGGDGDRPALEPGKKRLALPSGAEDAQASDVVSGQDETDGQREAVEGEPAADPQPSPGNGSKPAPTEAGASSGESPDQPETSEDAASPPGAAAAPKQRKTPDITDPDEVVYAAEGVFDTERFSNLKKWFKDGRRQGTPTT